MLLEALHLGDVAPQRVEQFRAIAAQFLGGENLALDPSGFPAAKQLRQAILGGHGFAPDDEAAVFLSSNNELIHLTLPGTGSPPPMLFLLFFHELFFPFRRLAFCSASKTRVVFEEPVVATGKAGWTFLFGRAMGLASVRQATHPGLGVFTGERS
jgi:hypothetical protein